MKKNAIYRVENSLREGEIACFHSYISLVRQNAALCGNGLTLSQTTYFRLFQTERVCRQKF